MQHQEPNPVSAIAYGGVLLDTSNRILVCKPRLRKDADFLVWTFPEGRAHKDETAEETALRTVLEITGYRAKIIDKVPGCYLGETGFCEYFLMQPLGEISRNYNGEVRAIKWEHYREAEFQIRPSPNIEDKNRDLAVLQASIELALKKRLINIPYDFTPWLEQEPGTLYGGVFGCPSSNLNDPNVNSRIFCPAAAPLEGERPMDTARRLLYGIHGIHAFAIASIPGVYSFNGKNARFFLMEKFSYEWHEMHGLTKPYGKGFQEWQDCSLSLDDSKALASSVAKLKSDFYARADRESATLFAFALRFDGYKAAEKLRWPWKKMRSKILTSIKKWYKTGAWPSDPTTKQTLFCLMQRAFFKENGFPYAEIAKPFRSLFFETAHTPIPEEDRMGGWYDDWAKKYGGDIDSAIRAVRAIHAENPCDDTIP